ncbi:flagellar motor switch protein FliM [Sphingomonas sp. GlSt437]|uniref:flagellar motor switch protein FliM n=2 Tax=Bacteria TaxID=2 RepID=UPI003A8A5BA2
MVNGDSDTDTDRRSRERAGPLVTHSAVFGTANLNPFGDLHTLQHLCALLSRQLRGVFEPFVRREVRVWADPLEVQRFSDYRIERGERLTAWLPVAMRPTSGQALIVLDGKFVLEMVDLFFGGPGEAPAKMPAEFSPAAEAMVKRLGIALTGPLKTAWEPMARIDFQPGHVESSAALIGDIDNDDALVITRFGIAVAGRETAHFDIAYPVSALKPYAPSLTGKVLGRGTEPDPSWRNGLTRSVMGVKFHVRSVLAEPEMSLAHLMALKEGDVIPINFGDDVPVMVGRDRLGFGTVGTSNGRAAVMLNQIERKFEEDYR